MIQATFTVPASEFTPAFFEQIRAFLRDADMEIRIQVRRKTKRGTKNGSAPKPAQGSDPQPSEEVFVKKYPSQPSPEEAERLVAALTTPPSYRKLDVDEIIREKNWEPIGQAEWDKRATELDIQESAEELIALLTK